MATVQDAIDFCRALLGDGAKGKFSDDTFLRFINEANRSLWYMLAENAPRALPDHEADFTFPAGSVSLDITGASALNDPLFYTLNFLGVKPSAGAVSSSNLPILVPWAEKESVNVGPARYGTAYERLYYRTGYKFSLQGNELSIGTPPNSDLYLNAQYFRHVAVMSDPSHYLLSDNKSVESPLSQHCLALYYEVLIIGLLVEGEARTNAMAERERATRRLMNASQQRARHFDQIRIGI